MITGLNHLTLAVTGLDRSLSFYCELLGCTLIHRWPKGAYLEAGSLWLCLAVCEHVDTRADYSHVAFSTTVKGLASLRTRLADYSVTEWQDNVSEGDSLYITDPDGHRLELHIGDLESRLEDIRTRRLHERPCSV